MLLWYSSGQRRPEDQTFTLRRPEQHGRNVGGILSAFEEIVMHILVVTTLQCCQLCAGILNRTSLLVCVTSNKFIAVFAYMCKLAMECSVSSPIGYSAIWSIHSYYVVGSLYVQKPLCYYLSYMSSPPTQKSLCLALQTMKEWSLLQKQSVTSLLMTSHVAFHSIKIITVIDDIDFKR